MMSAAGQKRLLLVTTRVAECLMNRFTPALLRRPSALSIALLVTFEGVSFARTPMLSDRAEEPLERVGTHAPELVMRTPLVAWIPLCRISRHPRDGLRQDQHACPLLLADAQIDSRWPRGRVESL
jgi:hypothetical protein